MTWAPSETQKTFYTLLSTDTALQNLLGGTVGDPRVYDTPNDNNPYPYVVYNQRDSADRSNTTKAGWTFNIQLDVFYRSDEIGNKPVQAIMAEIDRLFHGQDVCIEGWNIISLRRSNAIIETEDDNVTRHGTLVYDLLIGEA